MLGLFYYLDTYTIVCQNDYSSFNNKSWKAKRKRQKWAD